MTVDRSGARQLAAETVARGEPPAWFETLYAAADAGNAVVPWASATGRLPSTVAALLPAAPRLARRIPVLPST